MVIQFSLYLQCVGQLGITYIRFFWTQEKTEFLISGPALVLIYRQGLIWVNVFCLGCFLSQVETLGRVTLKYLTIEMKTRDKSFDVQI